MIRLLTQAFFVFLIFTNSNAQDNSIESQSIDSILSWLQENYAKDSIDFHLIALRTIKKAKDVASDKQMGNLHDALADWHGYHGLFLQDSLLYHDYKALDYYKKADDQESVAKIYAALSIDLLNTGDLEGAQSAAFSAIDIYKRLEDRGGLANCHRSLCYLFDEIKDYEKAIEYGNLAQAYYDEVDDYNRKSYTLLSLIQTYKKMGQLEKAQDVAIECIDLVDQKIPEEVFVLARAYGYKSDVSIEQGLLDQAIQESTKAYDIARARAGDDRAVSYRSGIADAQRLKGNCREAIAHYEAIIIQSEKQGQLELIGNIYEGISECYAAVGQSDKAHDYYKRYADLQIETQAEAIANLESEAVIKYETGKKDEALINQEKELQRRKRTQTIYLVFLAFLASLLCGVLYLFRKNKNINSALAIKNSENETLMKEIHHRVKNNLQILSSLLSLQSDDEEDLAISGALQESRNRVESMGMIHQKLYTKDNLTSINMKEYVQELCDHLSESFNSDERRINILTNVDVDDADVETAIPLGLIINELITNSMKYAFSESQEGEISVELSEYDGKHLHLQVADNGQGGSSNATDGSTHFGSRLIEILSKKLKGTINVNHDNGYETKIIFKRYKLT